MKKLCVLRISGIIRAGFKNQKHFSCLEKGGNESVMSPIQTVCVFCGSSTGKGSAFQQCARDLADALTAKKLHTVYGGASIGLMGILAEEVLARNGEITGVIVSSLVRKEIAHQELSRLFVVQTMHERKQKMFDLSKVGVRE